jgi:quercetin dioxygenase-like cupin family protein
MVEHQRSFVVRTGEGRSLPVGASTVRRLALGSDTADRSSVEEIDVPAGFDGPPPHFHNQTNHSWYVVEGELRLTVAGEHFDLNRGGFVYVPTGVSHTFGNVTSSDARMVQFTTPGGFDAYLEEIAEAFPAGIAIDPQRMIEIMARHDTYPAAN